MQVRDVANFIEQFAPLALQEEYDNCGLNVGNADAEVTGVLLAVDVTQSVIDEAISHGANLIISHHPLLFHPLKQITDSNFTERIVADAIRHGINIYAAHTNLDSAYGGLSFRVGSMLGLSNMRVMSPHTPTKEVAHSAEVNKATLHEHASEEQTDVPFNRVTGYGVVGELAEGRLPVVEFLSRVKSVLGCGAIRHSTLCHSTIARVAVSTGACASLTEEAIASGADIYLSADFRYNDFYTPDSRIIVADIGHFESEKCAIDLLYDIITKKISTFVVRKSESCINPVNYYY